MNRPVKIAQWGVGKMGKRMVRYAVERGGVFVAAFVHGDRDADRDLGELAGIAPLGVSTVSYGQARQVLLDTRPDICLVATRGSMADLRDTLLTCAQCGVNALTIGEEALWPWTAAPELTREVDEAFRSQGVTCAASGCPEIAWGALASTLSGCCARIDKLRVEGILNLEDYGKLEFLYDNHGVGLTPEEFRAKFHADQVIDAMDGHAPCYPGDQNGWLCRYMGLHPVRQYAVNRPYTYHEDVYSQNFDRVIPAGHVIGAGMVVTTETEEGVVLEFELAGKIYTPEDHDHYSITVFGEPNTTLVMDRPDTPAFTCATPINRIPDVINARPGFVTSEEFPRNVYRPLPLHTYVRQKCVGP